MKNTLLSVMALLTITACSQQKEPQIIAPEGYELVWHDEFNEGTT